MLEFIFTHPLSQQLVIDWPERAKRIVAELRAESTRLDLNAPLNNRVKKLLDQSPEFATWWPSYHVVQREGGQRSFQHPRKGIVHYQQTTWQLVAELGTKMIILVEQSED